MSDIFRFDPLFITYIFRFPTGVKPAMSYICRGYVRHLPLHI